MNFTEILNIYQGITETSWWQYQILGNTVGDFIGATVAFIIFLFVFKVFQFIILRRLSILAEKTKTDVDDTLIKIVKSLRPPFYSFIAFYFAVQFLTLGSTLGKVLDTLLLVWVVYQVIIAAQILIEYIFVKALKKEEDKDAQGAFGVIKNVIGAVLWMLGILVILSNMGVNITSVIAGLGIGGIAIAFAFQNILEDLFSSFAILFDKPFKVGDFIIVGEHKGVVQKMGIKTTRLKSLGGEEIVISNKELTSARLQNFKKMEERRIGFTFGVTYETPTEKLKTIPETVKDIIDSIEKARFDRSHFTQFDDSALTFETVYYVTTSEYAIYRDIQQEINLRIKESFEKENINMAYPTQTIYINKSS